MIPALLLVVDRWLWCRLLFAFDLLAMFVALVMLVFVLVIVIVLDERKKRLMLQRPTDKAVKLVSCDVDLMEATSVPFIRETALRLFRASLLVQESLS